VEVGRIMTDFRERAEGEMNKEKEGFINAVTISDSLREPQNITRFKFVEIVGVAIGEASMCWSETPKGVFDSSRASDIVDRIVSAHESALRELAEQVRSETLEEAAKFCEGPYACAASGRTLATGIRALAAKKEGV
jgi:hypothetical protein